MNKRIWTAIIAVLAVVGITVGVLAITRHSNSSTPPPASATHNAADIDFAQGMIPHHQQAVTMAELAATRAENADVKELASKIKAAQDPEIKLMTSWLDTWGEPVDPSMGGMHGSEEMPGVMTEDEMTALEDLSGNAFDKAFVKMMIAHHEGAITMAEQEQTDGKDAAAKELAGKIISAQQAEITQMNDLASRL